MFNRVLALTTANIKIQDHMYHVNKINFNKYLLGVAFFSSTIY